MSSNQRIGFGKKIRMGWLQRSLQHRLDGRSFEECKTDLVALVASTNPGQAAIAKILSVLRQVMFDESAHEKSFYDDALAIAKDAPGLQRAVCYGLSLASYSFFHSTADAIGRLANVQGTFSVADLVRRLKEKEGDRAFVQRVARYNISSLLDWDMIQCSARASTYSISTTYRVTKDHEISWAIECHLRGCSKHLEIAQVDSIPSLFPLKWEPISFSQIAKANPRIELVKAGPREERLSLRTAA